MIYTTNATPALADWRQISVHGSSNSSFTDSSGALTPSLFKTPLGQDVGAVRVGEFPFPISARFLGLCRASLLPSASNMAIDYVTLVSRA